ncbi:unnamed protein product [Nippostrongylus brasiliensis]|uniref:Acetyl-coenzyme A transporter 1 (inferred by orthology to a human protein) n=1 Tax=Nippostrongylus brasiliensis TaxID=27835 RepID=A0A0N4XNP3_NIPBR|nr:unnamed protein product [Nippostrongylus brasiliensis]
MLIFLQLNFFAAIQDIAVDGWALTILSRKNVGYASTCNAVGQTTGYFLGNVVFLSLESADFANTFIRSADNQMTYGIIDLAGFVFFWE